MQPPRQTGTVKWFSEDKGYGFITDPSGSDFYFHAKDIRGSILPTNGAVVLFESYEGKKGPAARSVEIQSQLEKNADDRISCPNCKKRIVPRIITANGNLSHSVCPFCGAKVKSFGSDWSPIVVVLLVLIFFIVSALTPR
jgi:cold shock CspA family protein